MAKQEPVRLSGVLLFERNLLDLALLISTSSIYLFCCATLNTDGSFVKFVAVFSSLCTLFNYHLESYRSFKTIRKCVHSLEADDKPALRAFLSSHLRYLKPGHVFEYPGDKTEFVLESRKCDEFNNQKHPVKQDTYRWANKIIGFFWPYLSHVVHHELNEFLARSKVLATTEVGLKRMLYAFVKQVDANILSIERCELGSNAPYIKSIHVSDERQDKDNPKRSLVYDLDLIYEGNMNISFICRYFCCCDSRLGLKDVFVHMSSRLIVGPIDDQAAMIEKFSFSLLSLPRFGYKGIALVELARLKIARRSLNRLIKEHLLFPRRVSIATEDLLANTKKRQQEVLQEAATNQPGQMGTSNDSARGSQPSPWTTRLVARLMLGTCLCSNWCLNICQEERLNLDSRRLLAKAEST